MLSTVPQHCGLVGTYGVPWVGLIWLNCCYLNGDDQSGTIQSLTLQRPENRQPCAGALLQGCQPTQGPAGQALALRVSPGSPPVPWGGDKAVTVARVVPSWHLLGATPLLDVLSTEMAGPGHCRLGPGHCSARWICPGNHEQLGALLFGEQGV